MPTIKICRKIRGKDGIYELPSGLNIHLVQRISQLEKNHWENVVPGENLFLSYGFLEAFERTAASNVKFHYVLVYSNSKPLAAFYFQVVRLTADEIVKIIKPVTSEVKLHGIGGSIPELVRKLREEKGMRILICGNNFISGEFGVGYRDHAHAKKVFDALAETMKAITKVDQTPVKISAILVKDYYSDTAKKTSDQLKSNRYHRFTVEPEMIVDLSASWKSFDDYLNAMNKKYRHRAKNILKKTEPTEEIELNGFDLERASPELYDLYHQVHLRAKFRLAALEKNYFTEMKKNFPQQFTIYGYRLNGKWIAFRSSFHLSTHLEAHFIGFDYKLNEEFPIYQRILYDYVKEGISISAKKVYLGRTAAEMKSNIGAVPHDLVCYIRHRNGFHNQVIRPFIDYLKPTEWIQRNPFKENGE